MNNDFSKKGQINTNPVAWQLFKETTPDYLYITDSYSIACEWKSKLNSNEKIIPLYTTPQIKELSDIDLTLILEVLIDSYDDTNRCYLEYKAMWEKSPTRKARIDGMKRMVDKHANAIEKIEAILKKASEK